MITIIFPFEYCHTVTDKPKLVLKYQIVYLMSALYILVLASITVAAFFLIAFIWSVRSDQYEDRQGAAIRMLQDDELTNRNNNI